MSTTRRGGIPGPESRTGLVRPAMTEAEFERRLAAAEASGPSRDQPTDREGDASDDEPAETEPAPRPSASGNNGGGGGGSRSKSRGRATKFRRVQRMFAIEEELDKKLWLYAIHVGKDRSEVVNDLLRPLVGSMVLYDSRDRRSNRGGDDSEN